jgi:hypothetical protein
MIQLADPVPNLREDSRYAIRLVNRGISFMSQTGWNILAEDIELH